MDNVAIPSIEAIIREYIESKETSYAAGKKRIDAEKEYNKLLTICGGEEKRFSLAEADKIYKAYHEILINEEQSKLAESRFEDSYEKLKELGRVLFHASITADITIPPVNGGFPTTKQVTVTFPHGEVLVA